MSDESGRHHRRRPSPNEGGDSDNGDGDDADIPVEGRQVRRHQKVRLWLSTCQQGALAAAAGTGRQQLLQLRHRQQKPFPQTPAMTIWGWGAFEDSGTFSADSRLLCEDSQLRLYSNCSTEKSSILRNASHVNPSCRQSFTSFVSSRSTRTSLNKLLLNKLKLLSGSTRTQQEESYSVESHNAVVDKSPAGSQLDQLSHNSKTPAEGPEPLVSKGSRADTATSAVSRGLNQQPRPSTATQRPTPSRPISDFISQGVKKSSVAAGRTVSEAAGGGGGGGGSGGRGSSSGGGGSAIGGGGGGGGSGGGGGWDSDTGASEEEPPRRPEAYHVRVLPAMCYLVWRPNMLRRECLMDRGKVAYLNAMHPSVLPMERLMSAVAARLDIEVPLLDSMRPDYANQVPRFEYVFRWHTPNGERVQISDRITDINHPEGQTGEPMTPVRIFISGSPGWLSKAK